MKVTNVLKGAGLLACGFVFGKAWGQLDCMDNILENNPDLAEVSYKAKTGTVTTRYNTKKKEDKEEA